MTAREAALSALAANRRSDAWSDAYLNALFEKENMEGRERALATRLCACVLQNRMLLDACIDNYVKGGLKKLQPEVLDVLRISAAQLLFFDKIPASAAVNEGVKLARKTANKGAAGLVNAVLRRVAENKAELALPPEPWLRYSHPRRWYEYFVSLIGEEKTLLLMQEDNSSPPVTVMVNPLLSSREAVLEELKAGGADVCPHPWLEQALAFSRVGQLGEMPAFKDGKIFVQDAAAALAVIAAAPKSGERVLDACAAPGGKSFLSAMLMKNEGEIISCDIHENKLSRLEKGAKRLGITIINARRMDAAEREKSFENGFDLVIADVPCSGMGVIRKKPEIRYKSFAELGGLPAVQLRILKNLSSYVKPGGRLLYSTCTLIREENEGVTDAFLRENADFEKEGFTLPELIGACTAGERTLWPFEYGTDGFYICLLRKKTGKKT
jgi:16S rRNA (cytosine967-C5)-methyltransferase